MSYFDIDDISVHGGITFSEPAISGEESIGSKRKINSKYVGKRNPILDDAEFITDNTEIGDDWWIFGFDTFHYGDNEYNWGKQAVIQETMNLMKQLLIKLGNMQETLQTKQENLCLLVLQQS